MENQEIIKMFREKNVSLLSMVINEYLYKMTVRKYGKASL